ncbi:MAG TPA: DUF748 domain-containing protein [Steroidobacteraceae bacterium]|nr:DUF748 domain-containing protein [Steroidobacteraceae bacterium]
MRGHVRLLGVLATLLVLYTLAGFLLVPALARHVITRYVDVDLGRRVSIGSVSCNPFTLTAQIDDFALSEADGSPLARWRLLRVSLSPSTLWHWAWTLGVVRLEQPVVNASIGTDGVLNLAKLEAPAAAQSTATSAPASSSSWPRMRIGTLSLLDGSVRFEDRSRGTPFTATLAPIQFSLNDFRTAPGSRSRYSFSARTNDGAQLRWSGTVSVRPVGSDGQFAITGVKVSTITAYLGHAMPVALRGGSADLRGDYHFTAARGSDLSLNLADFRIRGLQIDPKDSATGGAAAAASAAPWISLPDVDIAGTTIATRRRHIAVGQVTVRNAGIQLWREASGSLNLQRLLPPAATTVTPAAAPAAAVPAAPAAPRAPQWTVALERLAVQNATLEVEDRSVTPAVKLHVGPTALVVQNYSSTGSAPISFQLDTGLGASGRLQGSGSVVLSPLSASVKLDLKQFDLTTLQPYVAQQTGMTVYRGDFGAQLQLTYAASPPEGKPQLLLTGSLDATNFATRDNVQNADFITGRAVQVTGIRYQHTPDALRIARVSTRGVFGRVIIGANGHLNLTDVLRPQRTRAATAPAAAGASKPRTANVSASPPTGASPAAPAGAMPIRVDRVEITDGSANFTDHTVRPNFSAAILGLRGTIIGLSSDPSSRAMVQLEGSVNRYAPVSISGQVNLLSAATFTDLNMSFSNIELTTFNPYSGKFAGYSIAQGKLTTTMHYHVENRRLDATHHIVIDQLEFGPATATKPAVPLPVKLAVALLKDRNGVISLDLPVSGSIDDPNFHIGPIIWKVFVGLVTKIVTAPFSWLGSLFGGGGQQLAYVDFAPGSAALAAPQTQKLIQLSKALLQRPQLQLDIPLHTLSVADDAALAHSALEQAVAGAIAAGTAPAVPAAVPAAAPASPRLMALAALYRQQFGADPQYPGDAVADQARSEWLEQQLLPRFVPKRSQRDALARARADAVQAAVLTDHTLSPMRVFLIERESGGGPAGSVRMQLQLQ